MNRLPRYLLILLSLVGMAIGLYLTWVHLRVASDPEFESICNINQTFNCDVVNSSAYSSFWGIPLALFGVAFYAVTLVLGILGLSPSEKNRRAPELITFLGFLATLLSMGLAYISKFKLGAWCLFCIGMYGVNVGLLVVGYAASTHPFRAFLKTLDSELAAFYRSKLIYISAGVFLGFTWLGGLIYDEMANTANEAIAEKATSELNNQVGQAMAQNDLDEARQDYSSTSAVDIPLTGLEPTKGGANAAVTLVEFADFECPFCSRAAASLEEVVSQFGDQVKLIYKHYPLDISCNTFMTAPLHERACAASLAAICAQKQNKFWEMHAVLFHQQPSFSDSDLRTYADQIGLNRPSFESCLADPSTLATLMKDVETGYKTLDLGGTPVLYINGRKIKSGVFTRPELLQPLLQEIIAGGLK